jgi:hypothetical protein
VRGAILTFLLVAGLAVVVPAVSLAQSAGDEQYVDPFQNQDEQGGGGGGQGGSGEAGGGSEGTQTDSGTGSTGEPEGTPEAPAPAPTDEGGGFGATASGSPATGSQDVLPRTGLPVAVAALLGTVFLAAGVALRRSA